MTILFLLLLLLLLELCGSFHAKHFEVHWGLLFQKREINGPQTQAFVGSLCTFISNNVAHFSSLFYDRQIDVTLSFSVEQNCYTGVTKSNVT